MPDLNKNVSLYSLYLDFPCTENYDLSVKRGRINFKNVVE